MLRTHRKQLISCHGALATFRDNSHWKDVEAPSGSDVAARVTSEHEHIALMTGADLSNSGPNPFLGSRNSHFAGISPALSGNRGIQLPEHLT